MNPPFLHLRSCLTFVALFVSCFVMGQKIDVFIINASGQNTADGEIMLTPTCEDDPNPAYCNSLTYRYEWTKEGEPNIVISRDAHLINVEAGSYCVDVTAIDAYGQESCSTASGCHTVGNYDAEANFEYQVAAQDDCTISFTDLSTVGEDNAITKWSWDFGDGGRSFTQHPVHTYDEPGLYNVRLVVGDGSGNFSGVSQGVYVPCGGSPVITNSNINIAGEGQPVLGSAEYYTANITGFEEGEIVNYFWSKTTNHDRLGVPF
jgi:chitodextrinase